MVGSTRVSSGQVWFSLACLAILIQLSLTNHGDNVSD
jgi:hypothetical protein